MATLTYGSKRAREGGDEANSSRNVITGTSAGAGTLSNCRRWFKIRNTNTYRPPYTTLYRIMKGIDTIRDPVFGSPWWKQHFGYVTERIGATGPNLDRGYAISHVEKATAWAVPDSSLLPMYMLDLTQRPGLHGLSTFMRAWVPGNTNDVRWGLVQGQTNSAAWTDGWGMYSGSSQQVAADLTQCKGSLLKGVEAYFVLQGALSQPTEFRFDLVQFNDEEFCPNDPAYDPAVATSFYLRMIHKYLSSPIDRRPADEAAWGSRSIVRVLASEVVQITPKDTSVAGSTVPNQNVCHMKFDLNHLCAWAYDPKGYVPALAADQIDNPQKWNQQYAITGASDNALLDPRHRVFLMIRASGTVKKENATSTDYPQFDMRVIAHHSMPPSDHISN